MGANTYRLMSGFATESEASASDETVTGEGAALAELARASKVVFSSTLQSPLAWANTQLISGDAVEAVAAMKQDGTGPMRTLGSLTLCRSLLEAGLVDRFRVVVFPVITGHAPRLTCKWLLAYRTAVADVFKALADPTRRKILDELSERNGQTLFEICARLATKHQLGSSRQAISQHLRLLEAAGLIETRREGRFKFHYLNTRPLERLADRWLEPRSQEAR